MDFFFFLGTLKTLISRPRFSTHKNDISKEPKMAAYSFFRLGFTSNKFQIKRRREEQQNTDVQNVCIFFLSCFKVTRKKSKVRS